MCIAFLETWSDETSPSALSDGAGWGAEVDEAQLLAEAQREERERREREEEERKNEAALTKPQQIKLSGEAWTTSTTDQVRHEPSVPQIRWDMNHQYHRSGETWTISTTDQVKIITDQILLRYFDESSYHCRIFLLSHVLFCIGERCNLDKFTTVNAKQ